MNDKITFLKSMLPGLLPLFAFVIFDSMFEAKTAILLTIGFSILELIFHLIKNKKFEGFLIFDIALISVLGLISVKAGNPLFFKLKPAIIEFIITIILAVSVFTPANILLMMSKRYLKGFDLNKTQLKKLRKSSLAMFIIFAFHTALIVYAALFLSHKAWAFISGILFYILFGIYMVYEILKNKISAYLLSKKYRDDDWYDLLDHEGKIVGKAPTQLCHNNPDLIHGVVHMHIFDKDGNLLLEKHVDENNNQSAKWNTSISKNILSGWNAANTLIDETMKLFQLDNFKPVFLCKYLWKTDSQSELIYTFAMIIDNAIISGNDNSNKYKFWKLMDIQNNRNKDLFDPNFLYEFNMMLSQDDFFELLKEKF